jgi:hypothetical protein
MFTSQENPTVRRDGRTAWRRHCSRADGTRVRVTKAAIDLGPEAGKAAGRIVTQDTPEEVATVPASFTRHNLAPLLGVPRAKAS